MFAGHIGVAYAAKRKFPSVSIGWWLAATWFLDIVWPIFVLAGIEHFRIAPHLMAASALDFYDYPWTHSLTGAAVWSAVAALLFVSFSRSSVKSRAALLIAAVVLSHWFLDLVVHRPDLPLAGNSTPKSGLGVWNSVPATLTIELGILLAGFLLYAPLLRRRGGFVPMLGLTILFAVIQLGNVFGPPPEAINQVVLPALIGFPLFAGIAAFFDRKVTRAETAEKVDSFERTEPAGPVRA